MIAGPIERATHLLPQLKGKRTFKYEQGVEGCWLILWGLFKKVVIADSLAPIVKMIFDNYKSFSGISLILSVLGFTFQVYCDFSGYTDIARGVSKLLGIELLLNFNFPYFSKSIPEFWSRWHISLSSWLNDYVFTPLALYFRYQGKNGIFISVLITFIISGFWHGAAWHFVAWGAFHGLMYLPYVYSKQGITSVVNNKSENVTFKDLPRIFLTFCLVCFGYILFRANDIGTAIGFIKHIVNSLLKHPIQIVKIPLGKMIFIYIIPLILTDWWLRTNKQYIINTKNKVIKYLIYYIVLFLCLFYLSKSDSTQFIYFQF